jgi:hypothetical protein
MERKDAPKPASHASHNRWYESEKHLLLSEKEKRQAQRFMGTCRKSLKNNGEPSRARTCDPLIKSQLLYQLSYRPTAEENYTFVN